MRKLVVLSLVSALLGAIVGVAWATQAPQASFSPCPVDDLLVVHLDNSASTESVQFTLSDGDGLLGSGADFAPPEWELAAGEVLDDRVAAAGFVSQVQSAKPYTFTLSAPGMSDVSITSDFQDCHDYSAYDNFDELIPGNLGTMGNTAVGGSSVAGSSNRLRLVKYVAPPDINQVDSMWAYLDRAGTGSGYAVRTVIYTDASGVPASLVSNSSIELETNVALNSPDWYDVAFTTKPVLTPGNVYWIGIHMARATTNYYDTASGVGRQGDFTYSSGAPASWSSVTGDASQNRRYSIYLKYTGTGAALDGRSAEAGGVWDTAVHTWSLADAGSGEGVALATLGSGQEGFATLDTGLTNDYGIAALVKMSPTTNRAAPGVTVNYSDADNNVFFKLEVTSPNNTDGAIIGGITHTSLIDSGPADICGEDDIGLDNGEWYWVYVTRTVDLITAKVFPNDPEYGFDTGDTPLGTCEVDLSETGGIVGLGVEHEITPTEKSVLDAGDRMGLRVKIFSNEDDGLSRWATFSAWET